MTNDPVQPASGRDQLREEAATWFARMRGEDAAQHRPAFEAWLARGAVHRAAYNRIGEIFAAGKVLGRDVAVTGRNEAGGIASRARTTVIGSLLLAVLAVALASGIVSYRNATTAQPSRARASVAPGNAPALVRRLRLNGGGAVVLDSGASLAALSRDGAPAMQLVRGRARFTVVPGDTPLLIFASLAAIRLSNGTIDLAIEADEAIQATALRGSASVWPRHGSSTVDDRHPTLIAAGQCRAFDHAGRSRLCQPRGGSEWPDSILEFRRAPLREVIAQANRYAAIKIVLGDPQLGSRTISGRFRLDDADRLASRLAAVLSLRVERRGSHIIVLREPE